MNKIPSYFGVPKHVKNDMIHTHYLLTPVVNNKKQISNENQYSKKQYYNSNNAINSFNDFDVDDY